MKDITRKINGITLMKGGVLYFLIIAFFGSLGGLEVPVDTYAQSIIYSVDSHQSTPEELHAFDSSSLGKILADFKIEEEKEEENYHHYSYSESFQPVSRPLVLDETIGVSLFPKKRIIKLFILFHSWKSFLA